MLVDILRIVIYDFSLGKKQLLLMHIGIVLMEPKIVFPTLFYANTYHSKYKIISASNMNVIMIIYFIIINYIMFHYKRHKYVNKYKDGSYL